MELSKKKNTIVLKGMASNVIEEAIVILKPNIKLKQNEYNLKNTNYKEKNIQKEFVLSEAEKTIDEYVDRIQKENKKVQINKIKKKYKALKILNIVLVTIIIGIFVILF